MAKVRASNTSGGGGGGYYGTFSATTSSFTDTDFGFVPTKIITFIYYSNQAMVLLHDITNGKIYQYFQNQNPYDATSAYGSLMYMDGTVFKFKAPASIGNISTVYCMAVK